MMVPRMGAAAAGGRHGPVGLQLALLRGDDGSVPDAPEGGVAGASYKYNGRRVLTSFSTSAGPGPAAAAGRQATAASGTGAAMQMLPGTTVLGCAVPLVIAL